MAGERGAGAWCGATLTAIMLTTEALALVNQHAVAKCPPLDELTCRVDNALDVCTLNESARFHGCIATSASVATNTVILLSRAPQRGTQRHCDLQTVTNFGLDIDNVVSCHQPGVPMPCPSVALSP